MTQTEILERMREINPAFSRQIETLLSCKAKFCRIVMKPNPEEDNLKRNGKQRVFLVNCRATYARMMKRHVDPNYRFDGFSLPSVVKARKTCTEKAIFGVVESVVEKGRTRLQFRNVDMRKVESISCGDIQETF